MTSDAEREVLEKLGEAYNLFVRLPVQHPMEADEFCRAVHVAQGIVAIRVARRADPDTWPTHKA